MISGPIPEGDAEDLLSSESSGDDELLEHAKRLVRNMEQILGPPASRDTSLDWVGREPKAGIDRDINQALIAGLAETGLPILSEEQDAHRDWRSTSRLWIVDPLDGTLNYVRGTGPCAIAVSLWDAGIPVFGVIYDIVNRLMAWGGRASGARWEGDSLSVSDTSDLGKAVLCTGIPSSFDFNEQESRSRLLGTMSLFGKVRMVGSAASSLLLVARGAADCYFEDEIKIWDVAAGIALVEGAGGSYTLTEGKTPTTVGLLASNRALAGKLTSTLTTI